MSVQFALIMIISVFVLQKGVLFDQAEESVLPVAWRIVNDSLRTDVSLLYPPHQVRLLCRQDSKKL